MMFLGRPVVRHRGLRGYTPTSIGKRHGRATSGSSRRSIKDAIIGQYSRDILALASSHALASAIRGHSYYEHWLTECTAS
jgi:hypothetical protein